MAGYRFCRSDDVPLLVAALNACWAPHFEARRVVTLEDFKRGVRELGLWASSCMVAFEGDEPIGVLIGAKRDGDANCVHRLAVRPGFERRGHGRHLLTSLADKAAILGPPRLVAEIPAAWSAIRKFFERSGFAPEETYADFVLADAEPTLGAADADARLLVAVTLDELVEHGAFDVRLRRAWTRSAASLRARAGEIRGLAIATDRIEAYVLFRPERDAPGREIVALGTAAGAPAERLLAPLLARLRPAGETLRFPLVADRETSFATLAALGFRRERETIGYVAVRS